MEVSFLIANGMEELIENLGAATSLFSIVFTKDGVKELEGNMRLTKREIWSVSNGVTVLGNTMSKKLYDSDVKEYPVSHAVLDLSDEGDRWEGDTLNDKPYGWGVQYDKDNHKVYEGFRVGEMNLCYGCQYYSDIEKIEYEGEWCGGKRWGNGTLYDRNGSVVYDGEWVNDRHLERIVTMETGREVLHNHIEELTVSDNSCNDKEWRGLAFNPFTHLRVLSIGDNCFRCVTGVIWEDMIHVERITVGKGSFSSQLVLDSSGDHGFLSLKNCPELKELRIGIQSFSNYSTCVIEETPSLEVIEIGDMSVGSYNFFYSSLTLKGVRHMWDLSIRRAFSQLGSHRLWVVLQLSYR